MCGGSLLVYWTADYLVTLQTSSELEVKEIKKKETHTFKHTLEAKRAQVVVQPLFEII